ncbi:hypothetical protein CI109_104635 [Kwoniella shandongensis]|uniref:Aminotransferase class I/classII large domain-containing protein n=1 Tax=Kwoniella shandongensis TaxID=1734106 RepID=A0AAJ8LN61_9TREE
MSDTSDLGEKTVHPPPLASGEEEENPSQPSENDDGNAEGSTSLNVLDLDAKEDAGNAMPAQTLTQVADGVQGEQQSSEEGVVAVTGGEVDEGVREDRSDEVSSQNHDRDQTSQQPELDIPQETTEQQPLVEEQEHEQDQDHIMSTNDDDDEEGFDPATLANLAALSRIVGDDDEDEDQSGQDHDQDGREHDQREQTEDLVDGQQTTSGERKEDEGLEIGSPKRDGPLTREQVQEFVNNLSHARDKDKETDKEESEGDKDKDKEGEKDKDGEKSGEGEREKSRDREIREEEEGGDQEDEEEELRRKGDDDEYDEGKAGSETGKGKRRRNRTTLSCTECHRRKRTYAFMLTSNEVSHTDFRVPLRSSQNIRCIKRGVPGMCRMEHPILPQRKRRKVQDDEDINYELGLRVQALESLLRSGSLMDADQASAAARETIMHATRAANAGSQDANNALAQLTQSVSSGGGIGGMSQDAQSSLLLDVLQQLTAASMGRSLNGNGSGEAGNRRGLELWSSIPTASQETTVAVTSAFESDDTPTKINLSLPGFREDNGKIFVPPTVRYVENKLRNENILAKEAVPIEGYHPFLDAGIRFAYGVESQPYRHKRISAIQALSLTGALRLAATFLSRFPATPNTKTVYIPSPTADEDTTALQDAGLEIRSFRFLDLKTGSVDWEALREDLQDAPPKSIVLLQVSGSMPSGAELTTNQWRLLATLLQERELIPLVMMAFQGLSTGDTNRDAQALRFMVHEGLPVVLVQSFDAMMGLYADSPAIVSIVTSNAEDKERVDSQLRSVARGMWFHPSPWGAYVAHQILSDQKLYPAWLAEIKAMSDRLRSVREKLFDLLANKLKTPGTWLHLKRASGMYCTALLPPSQAEALTTKRHVHLLPEGCFNLGCLNAPKIDILARGIDHVVREGIREAEEQQAQRLAMELALAAAKEQQAREEAEAQALQEAAEAEAAREEDTLLMERSIANAIEAQKRAEEDEKRREEERKVLDEQAKKAREREEIARQAEAILATI